MPTNLRFTQKFADSIVATLECHDRVIFKGYLPFYCDDLGFVTCGARQFVTRRSTGRVGAFGEAEDRAAAFLSRLRETQHDDALLFLAHCLPKRLAIWWGCQCLWCVKGTNLELEHIPIVRSIVQWIKRPTEPLRRQEKPTLIHWGPRIRRLSSGCLSEIVDLGEGIVALHEVDAFPEELPGQPLVAIDVDLDGEGEPGLQADVDEAEPGISTTTTSACIIRLS